MKDYLIVIFVVLGMVVGLLSGLAITDTKVIEVPGETVTVEIPANCSNAKLDYLYDQATEEVAYEVITENAILDEINSKGFKRDLVKAIMNSTLTNNTLESYKDIYRIRILDSEIDKVDVDDATGDGTFDLKVYYYLDGDDEETEKARFTATFNVTDIDDDLDVNYILNLDKIYE